MTSDPNIASIPPRKRNCYFDHEHPLSGHQKYSQVCKGFSSLGKNKVSSKQASCFLECRMNKVLTEKSTEDKCIPWYYPLVDPALRLCSPFEARDFGHDLEKISHDECKV